MKNKLICMVGLPRSGKSEYSRYMMDHNCGLAVVNPDSVRLAIHGQRFRIESEPLVWANVSIMVRSLFSAGHHTVIVDATNVSKKRRVAWYYPNDWDLEFHVMNRTAEECIQQAQKENDLEIIPVIERMNKEFDLITKEEGGEIYTITRRDGAIGITYQIMRLSR